MTAEHGDLPPALRELLTHAASPGYERWRARIRAAGGCSHPLRLTGKKITAYADTGEVIEIYTTTSEPGGYLLTACGNRRATVCPICSAVYWAGTFHLIRAGLVGGKDIPEDVRGHPRLFLTLTTPSFGPVYTRRTGADGKVLACRPRRDTPICQHCCALWCTTRHDEYDPQLGQPLRVMQNPVTESVF